MAGHSKWANIKHRKGAQDAKRGKIFTKIIKEISVSVKQGGADVNSNPRLRVAIQNAKGVNMPKDNVERAIKKADGLDSHTYLEVNYEGYGPYGIAIFIECTTDNINRTVAEVRSIFNKNGGELGKNGSLEFLFEKKGVFIIREEDIQQNIEELEMYLIDFGLEELELNNDFCTVICDFSNFGTIQMKIDEMGINIQSSSVQRIAKNSIKLNTEEGCKILQIIDKFEDLDDVQQVFHNLHVTDSIIEKNNE